MVEGGGFEPPKAEPSDLQSDPFGHSGTPPRGHYITLVDGIRSLVMYRYANTWALLQHKSHYHRRLRFSSLTNN